MKDIRGPGTLFTMNGVLYETVGHWSKDVVVNVKPVREADQKKCECGRTLHNQSEYYALAAPNLQDNIDSIYIKED